MSGGIEESRSNRQHGDAGPWPAQRSASAAAEGRRLDAVVRVCACSIGWKPLLNDVIRPQEQRRRDREAERFCGFQIEDKLEACWLLHGQVSRERPFEDLVDVARRALREVIELRGIGDKPTCLRETPQAGY